MRNTIIWTAVPLLAGSLLAGPAFGRGEAQHAKGTDQQAAAAKQSRPARSDERQDAQEGVREATKVVKQMKSNAELKKALDRSKGVFIIPDYGRGAFVVGGSGGSGVVLEHKDGKWSDPVFFNIGSISVGPQAGGSGGSIALLLMTDRAAEAFRRNNKFSLDAQAGLTIINFSARAKGSLGRGDILLWSNTAGAYAGASIAVSDVNYDEDETAAYYRGAGVPSPAKVLDGGAGKAPESAQKLKEALG